MDADCKIDDFVSVSLRIRPAISQDNTESSCLQVISKEPPILFVLDRAQTYHFDNIFKEEVDQETVYNETVKPLVEYVKQGYSCTVFAYGQTGTGKTYTMGTDSQIRNSQHAGLIPRALEQFFTYSDDDIETDISVSFIEIYNEKVFDLLQNNKPPLSVKGFRVEGLSQEKIFSSHEAKHFLRMGNRNRHCSETKQNSNSSRSHAVFTIYCNVRHSDHETTAKLNLVDLAGCESVKKTGNQGSTFQEGVNINKGLLCIGQVMTALSTNASFVPYRQSIITTILQDSLNRKNLVSLIACVNGNPEDCNETVQTLEFAQRVKKMKNKPEVNEVVMQYKRDNPTLFQPIRTSCTPFKRPTTLFQTPCLAKRAKIMPLKAVNEHSENNSGVDSPKSLSSISVSSITSNIDAASQNLSPVIKKYMTAMESSLADRIETLIKNTLKRPSRSSLLAKETEKSNKENTPGMSWNKIQNEVSKLVRSEIAQLTLKATRATSSPIDGGLDKIRKVLTYESPVLESAEKENSKKFNDKSGEQTVFKVPELPIIKKKSAENKRTPSVSPIEFVARSARLSLKNFVNDSDLNLNYTENDMNLSNRSDDTSFDFNASQFEKRRSVRLAKKRSYLQDSLLNASIQKEKNRSVNKSENSFKDEAVFKVPELIALKKKCATSKRVSQSSSAMFEPRRSTRLSLKRINNDVLENSDMSLELSYDYTKNNISKSNSDQTNFENRRSSVRLAKKRNDLQQEMYKNSSILKESNNNSLDDFDLNATAEIINIRDRIQQSLSKKNVKTSETSDKSHESNKRRKNVRVINKTSYRNKVIVNTKEYQSKLTVKATPAGRKVQNCETSVDSPATAHTKHVLMLLNDGNAKQLEKLHSIGPKTAQQVLLFREIKGPLNKISDLSQMPGWSGKKYKIFIAQNFIKDEFL